MAGQVATRIGFTPVATNSCANNIAGHIVFPKRYASGEHLTKYHHEQAYLLSKGWPATPEHPPADVIPWSYTGNNLHPTQKPVGSLKPLIGAFSKPGDIVLDPFTGSGPTLVAATETGRRFIGIKLDPDHQHTAVHVPSDLVAMHRVSRTTKRLPSASTIQAQLNPLRNRLFGR